VKSFVASLLFVAMAMGVNDQQNKNNQPPDEKDDDDWLILPNRLHKTGGIGIHSLSLYTCFRQNQIRGAIAVFHMKLNFLASGDPVDQLGICPLSSPTAMG